MCTGEAGEAEPAENRDRGQAADADLMDGETEGDTVVIAGQPEVLSTQAMQVKKHSSLWNCSLLMNMKILLQLNNVCYSRILVGGE